MVNQKLCLKFLVSWYRFQHGCAQPWIRLDLHYHTMCWLLLSGNHSSIVMGPTTFCQLLHHLWFGNICCVQPLTFSSTTATCFVCNSLSLSKNAWCNCQWHCIPGTDGMNMIDYNFRCRIWNFNVFTLSNEPWGESFGMEKFITNRCLCSSLLYTCIHAYIYKVV